MRSFILWYKKREAQKEEEKMKAELDLHINLWKNQKGRKEEFIFDFGFFIDNIKKIKTIYLYIPFKAYPHDLGIKVRDKHSLIDAIFNEKCKITSLPVGKRILVSIEKKEDIEKKKNIKKEFMFYFLGDDQINIKEVNDSHGGSIVEFNVENILGKEEEEAFREEGKEIEGLLNIKKYYFRFRLKGNKEDIKFIKNQDYINDSFSNLFTRTEIIDFRLNDIKTCSEAIKEKYVSNMKFNINKIHYLLLRNFNDDFIYYDGNVSSRMLESDLWKDYIEETNDDLMAYHIKRKKGEDKEFIESFTNLSRFRYQRNNLYLSIKYFIFLLLSSIIPGITTNLIYGKWNEKHFLPMWSFFILTLIYPILFILFFKGIEKVKKNRLQKKFKK
ncbi:hypothetical protein [Fusobacterium sp.]|uniref:hypothetical protein n=1 Tax=Fusobacterium sp. TaxID=68766 RepID=UPI0025B8ECEC|nr:hypothetical protein [Fusobacterium sp.]